MPVTGWRSPALAPVYALTTAFVVVLGIGTLAPKPVLMVRMNPAVANTTVEIFEEAGGPVGTGQLSAQGTYELPGMAGNRKVCVRPPVPWRVTHPAGGCTTGQVGADVQVEVVRKGRVSIVFDGDPLDSAKVSLRDNTSVESAELSRTDFYQPRGSLEGQTICVQPPPGWVVRTPGLVRREDGQCTAAPVTKPGDDIEFRLAEGGLR